MLWRVGSRGVIWSGSRIRVQPPGYRARSKEGLGAACGSARHVPPDTEHREYLPSRSGVVRRNGGSMTIISTRSWAARVVVGLGLAVTVAACAPQGGPQASAPPASQMSLPPPGQAATPPGGSMPGMNHSNMPGMNHSSMPGMNHSNMPGMNHSNMPGMQGGNMQGGGMSGMSMQDMMKHCTQMRADARPGMTMSPDMQAMMAHCDQMGGSTPRR